MARTPWYDSPNPDRVGVNIGARIFVAILAVLAISAAVWGISVATSGIRGRGDAIRSTNSGGNRLAQQAYFEQTYADIKAADQNLDLPGNDTEQAGRTAYCRRLVADYNAAARKQVAERFRAVDLPAQIDLLDSTTDCKKG